MSEKAEKHRAELRSRLQARILEGTPEFAWEQKIAKDTKAPEQSIDYCCPDCGMEGEWDCITDGGVIKEAKITGKAVEASQYTKHRSAAAALFPGASVHVAVPAKEARNVTPAIPRSDIQRH